MKIKLDDFLKRIVSRAYPEYRGRKFFLAVSERPIDVRSWWDGGSRTYYKFVNLATGEVSAAVPAQSAFDKPLAGADKVELPLNFACITHAISCGRDCGITFVVRPENAAKFLPAEIAVRP